MNGGRKYVSQSLELVTITLSGQKCKLRILGEGVYPGLSGWTLTIVTKEAEGEGAVQAWRQRLE